MKQVMASTSRVDTKYDPETIVSKNNHISSTATSSSSAIISGTFGYNDFSYCDDPKNAIIDETFMPVELRGKTWTINKVLGEGWLIKTILFLIRV